ncbi:MAG TPA: PIN domain-containing protein [Dehalococcoidia bacterium]|nr:PIN domain-containing protein [Dehalococcoidia bacterium]
MPDLPFLDTNLFLRHLTQDDLVLARRATALWRRIAGGAETVETADTVVFETVFTLQRFYHVSRGDIRDGLLPLLLLRGVRLANKRRYRGAFDLYVSMPPLSFADCFHIAIMEQRGLTRMVSFDRALGRIPGLTRMEPNDSGELTGQP